MEIVVPDMRSLSMRPCIASVASTRTSNPLYEQIRSHLHLQREMLIYKGTFQNLDSGEDALANRVSGYFKSWSNCNINPTQL